MTWNPTCRTEWASDPVPGNWNPQSIREEFFEDAACGRNRRRLRLFGLYSYLVQLILKDAGLNIRFHDLRHTCITKLAEGQASEQTLMSIAGHLSGKMLEHYSHIRMAAKRTALEAIAKPVFDSGGAQNWAQSLTD